jgi:hemerythrin-like domain-containing protein/glyoxylase-like metal-dependent hydrolase (beta-lactamase superfamily II)
MQALQHLKREHAVIRRMVDRARRALHPLDTPVLGECVDFFVEMVDRVHARQEEHVLFVAISTWAPDLSHGPIQALQKEHNLARAYLRAAKDAVHRGPDHHARLTEAVRRYVDLVAPHMDKEDELLFELARLAVPPSRDQELLDAMLQARREALDDVEYQRWISVAENGGRAQTLVLRPPPPPPPGHDIMDARTLGEDLEHQDQDETGYSMRAGGVLFDEDGHRAVWLHDFGRGLAVQANQFLIIDEDEGMILDPGGPKVYPDVLAETQLHLHGGRLRYVFLSHQDPDVGTSLNAWLMDTKAEALTSRLWSRFLPHFGIDKLLAERMRAVPDQGGWVPLGRRELMILPAHYLHSCGNLQIYDPTARILFSGDLGASVGADESVVSDFEAYRPKLEVFHRRYMGSSKALQAWVRMVRELDIQMIAPQHGALFRGPEMVGRFLDWCEGLTCGIDAYAHLFELPARTSHIT